MNPMKQLKIAKVVLNIGVGEAGERLGKAEVVLTKLSGCKPVRTLSKSTNRDLGIRLGMPIGCKVTLRGENAINFLKESLWVRENRLPAYCFSKTGGVSFGIPDYTGYKNESYDPDIGIFGLDRPFLEHRLEFPMLLWRGPELNLFEIMLIHELC